MSEQVKIGFRVVIAILLALFSAAVVVAKAFPCQDLSCSFPIELLLPIAIVLFLLWYMLLTHIIAKNVRRSLVGIGTFFFAGVVLYQFVAHPFQVLGDDVGAYKNGEVVFAAATFLLPWHPISRGDVVVLQLSTKASLNEPIADSYYTAVALVRGVPGDSAQGATYLSEESVGTTVPSGFYLVRFGTSKKLRVIPASQITYSVWYPVRKGDSAESTDE